MHTAMQCTGAGSLDSSKADQSDQATRICVVEGCAADLSGLSKYCQNKKVCAQHQKADCVRRVGSDGVWRFCQQCGKLELLSAFDGHRRSCRKQLARRCMLRGGPAKLNRSSRTGALFHSMNPSKPASVATGTVARSSLASDLVQQQGQEQQQLQQGQCAAADGTAAVDTAALQREVLLYESKAALLRMQIELLQLQQAARVAAAQELQQQWEPVVTPADTLVPMMPSSASSGTGVGLLHATGMTAVGVKGEAAFPAAASCAFAGVHTSTGHTPAAGDHAVAGNYAVAATGPWSQDSGSAMQLMPVLGCSRSSSMTAFGSGSTEPATGINVSANRPTALLNLWHQQQQQQQCPSSAHTADVFAMLPGAACGHAGMPACASHRSAPVNACSGAPISTGSLVASFSRSSFTWPQHQQQQQQVLARPASVPQALDVFGPAASAGPAHGMSAPLPLVAPRAALSGPLCSAQGQSTVLQTRHGPWSLALPEVAAAGPAGVTDVKGPASLPVSSGQMRDAGQASWPMMMLNEVDVMDCDSAEDLGDMLEMAMLEEARKALGPSAFL